MDFSEVVGSFGRWQVRVFIFLTLFNVVGMWQNFSIVFLAGNVPFRCYRPLPSGDGGPPFDGSCRAPNSSEPCRRFEYDTSDTSQTIVSEWDLVCDHEWLVSLSKSSYMIGFLVSVIVFGQISDCIGRFPTIVMCYVITCVSMFLSLLSNSFIMFIILRFFHALGRAGASTVGYVLIMEMVGPKHQAEVGIAVQLGWSVGFVTLVGVAWFFRHWFWLQLVISASFLPFVLFFGLIPESPRWLLTQGKFGKLERLLRRACNVNKRPIKEGTVKDLAKLKVQSEVKKTATMIEVLKMPKMRIRTIYMIYIWFVNAFMYYALSYNTSDLVGNPYLNFFVAGVLEFPSYALVFWGIKRWGRRPTLLALMAVGAAATAAIVCTPSDFPWLTNLFAMVGKFCFTGSFGLLYLYTTEVFPTSVRNATLGSCSMCARIGSILAPFLRDLGKATHSTVPNVLCTVLALTSGAVSLMLPETRGLDLPDTLQEGEDLGRSAEEAVRKS